MRSLQQPQKNYRSIFKKPSNDIVGSIHTVLLKECFWCFCISLLTMWWSIASLKKKKKKKGVKLYAVAAVGMFLCDLPHRSHTHPDAYHGQHHTSEWVKSTLIQHWLSINLIYTNLVWKETLSHHFLPKYCRRKSTPFQLPFIDI